MNPLPEPLQLKQLTATQLEQAQRGDALIVDTRAAEQFASCHIVGAVQIGLVGPFASWAAILVKPTQRILLIAEDVNRAFEAQYRLARVGLRDVIGNALVEMTPSGPTPENQDGTDPVPSLTCFCAK